MEGDEAAARSPRLEGPRAGVGFLETLPHQLEGLGKRCKLPALKI